MAETEKVMEMSDDQLLGLIQKKHMGALYADVDLIALQVLIDIRALLREIKDAMPVEPVEVNIKNDYR